MGTAVEACAVRRVASGAGSPVDGCATGIGTGLTDGGGMALVSGAVAADGSGAASASDDVTSPDATGDRVDVAAVDVAGAGDAGVFGVERAATLTPSTGVSDAGCASTVGATAGRDTADGAATSTCLAATSTGSVGAVAGAVAGAAGAMTVKVGCTGA